MASKSEEQFLADVMNKVYQFIYRSLEEPFDLVIQTVQIAAGVQNLNWHREENKERLKNIFTTLAGSIDGYTLEKGDFRSYVLLAMINIVVTEYKVELMKMYLDTGYDVLPETIINSLDSNYSPPVPQNTNFPAVPNTSEEISPATLPLIPDSLYTTGI